MTAVERQGEQAVPDGVRPKVLYLSRSYPNVAMPRLGLWVEGMIRYSQDRWESHVIAPVPYCPPLPFLNENFTRYRKVPAHSSTGDAPVDHPRILTPPGGRMRILEGDLYLKGVAGRVRAVHRTFPFDLIHAHFTYPDGWVAARLGQEHGVPVVITEHSSWRTWADREQKVLERARWAVSQCAAHVSVGSVLCKEMNEVGGGQNNLHTIHLGVDQAVFTLPPPGSVRKRDQILFVAAVRQFKGLDVLLDAFARMVREGRKEHLVVVGEVLFSAYRKTYDEAKAQARALGLDGRVTFLQGLEPAEVARQMQESAILVSASRRETLGMVMVEALACGTPVVATRSGGPQDYITPEVGVLVPLEDPDALARGMVEVLDRQDDYAPQKLRAHILRKFAWNSVTSEYLGLYKHILRRDSDAVPET
jgi:glycosyltransferase involved in cell wall biosynthesis